MMCENSEIAAQEKNPIGWSIMEATLRSGARTTSPAAGRPADELLERGALIVAPDANTPQTPAAEPKPNSTAAALRHVGPSPSENLREARPSKRGKVLCSLEKLGRRVTTVAARALRRGRPCYLSIWESDLRVIAGYAAVWGSLEVPMSMHGAFDHYGRPIVFLVLGPGPKAIYQSTYCEHDLDHYCSCCSFLGEHFGLQPVGGSHSHHGLRLYHPSSGDAAQVRSVTSRNDFSHWCDIIATTTAGDRAKSPENQQHFGSPPVPTCRVRLDAFIYPDPSNGRWVRVPIRVHPGMSPVRLALLASQQLDANTLGLRFADFPLDQITYDSFVADSGTSEHSALETLAMQLSRLPGDVQKGISLRKLESSIAVRLPIDLGGHVEIDVAIEAPHCVLRVRLWPAMGSAPVDLTDRIVTEGRCDSVDRTFTAVHAALFNFVCPDMSGASHEPSDIELGSLASCATDQVLEGSPTASCADPCCIAEAI